MGKKRLTTKSHYECSLILNEHLQKQDLDFDTEEMCKLFIIDGLNYPQIAEKGFYSDKRKNLMSEDMIRLRIRGVFGEHIVYDEKPTLQKTPRNKDHEHTQAIWRYKKNHSKENQKCALCGSADSLELDHILPYKNGGTDDESNLQWLCHKCHSSKTQAERIFYQTSGLWKKPILKGPAGGRK